MTTVNAGDFWSSYMPQEAAAAACRYISTRGGAALGAFAGGAIGGFFTAGAGAAGGVGAGSFIGGAGGAALGAAFCPSQPPTAGQYPLDAEAQSIPGQCPVEYDCTFTILCQNYGRPFNFDPFQYEGYYSARVTGPIGELELPGTRTGGLASNQNPPVSVRSGNDALVALQSNGNNRNKDNGDHQALELIEATYTRVDGQPDNCGGIPGGPRFPPPGEIPDITQDPEARTTLDVDVDFGGTLVNINGDLVITGPTMNDNRIGIGFNFDGLDFILFPDATINIGGGNKKPQDPEADNKQKELKGLFYSVTNTSEQQQEQAIGDRIFYYPRFGSIKFSSSDGSLNSALIQIATDKGYVSNPLPQLFTQYDFTPYKAANAVQFIRHDVDICCRQSETQQQQQQTTD